jgi:hypothetical protein
MRYSERLRLSQPLLPTYLPPFATFASIKLKVRLRIRRVASLPVLCRFSDAGKTCSPRAHAAGVRKAPGHEIAVGRAPGGAASAMGIWAGRGCQSDLMAAVRMIALGQKIAESTLNARPVRCASGFGVGLRAGVARRCKRERCRARASQNGGGRCGGGSMVPTS